MAPSQVPTFARPRSTTRPLKEKRKETDLSKMAEGGTLPWKVQKIDESRGPAASFSGLHNPLPPPPKGMAWVKDAATNEWSVQSIHPPGEDAPVVEAEAANSHDEIHYLEHKVAHTDTFQGICLRYKITPTELRRTNGFSGSNLALAPMTLWIPVSKERAPALATPVRPESRDEKIVRLRGNVPGLSRNEARAYLELNDWDADAAIKDAQSDAKEDFAKF
mmetsp:Transcript_33184/g.76506  ORF Transcript_33184/g.76506 Transcript_33184/m.76506 type:complete len:220 (+) Transcript_33184:236-895(+)